MVGILFGQEVDTVEVHPCDSPLLEQMKGKEKPPLKLRQRVAYTINVIKCRFSAVSYTHLTLPTSDLV